MRRPRVLAVAIPLALIVLICAVVHSIRVDSSFATSAKLRFHYGDTRIDANITDPDDLKALKEILRGTCSYDIGVPGCGFTSYVSITLTDGRKSVTLCPACDACGGFRLGDSNWYIGVSQEQRRRFEAIVRKYGMTFPCV